MDTVLQNRELSTCQRMSLRRHRLPFGAVLLHLPEKRLQEVGKLAVRGIIGGQSPVVTQIARGVRQEETAIWPMAKRLYRFL